MRPLWQAESTCLVIAVMCLVIGCSNPRTELDLTSFDPSKDQYKIAEFYSHEATKLRQMAHDLVHRALLYERLFGPKSDWVEGTRLLAQTYEDAAAEQERTAEQHRNLVRGGQAFAPVRVESSP